jgi:hypothetical protein
MALVRHQIPEDVVALIVLVEDLLLVNQPSSHQVIHDFDVYAVTVAAEYLADAWPCNSFGNRNHRA